MPRGANPLRIQTKGGRKIHKRGRHKSRNPSKDALRQRKRKEAGDLWKFGAGKKLKKMKLRVDPVCEVCNSSPAEIVHHIKDRATHPELSLDFLNLQSVCSKCHNFIHSALEPCPEFDDYLRKGVGFTKDSRLPSTVSCHSQKNRGFSDRK